MEKPGEDVSTVEEKSDSPASEAFAAQCISLIGHSNVDQLLELQQEMYDSFS
jgi:hypothetical protein